MFGPEGLNADDLADKLDIQTSDIKLPGEGPTEDMDKEDADTDEDLPLAA